MVTNSYQSCREQHGSHAATRTSAAFIAIMFALMLGIALAAPHAALAAEAPQGTTDTVSWTGKYGDTVTLSRLAGDDADETAAAISQEGFESSEYAIIARMDDFADALGASGLAGTLECPILLTSLDELSDATAKELERLGAETVYVIGGTGALSEQIDEDLSNIPSVKTRQRIWGYYSWDTSLECANAITEHGGNPRSEAIVAVSCNFQDALSISSYAYHYQVPLILEDNSYGVTGTLTSDAISFINDTEGTLWVVGGNAAVGKETVEGVFTDHLIVRLWGEDGYDTSNQIATYMLENKLLSVESVGIASGGQKAHGVDALAGAALVGKQGGVMLLANGNPVMESENYTTLDQEEDSQGAAAYLTTNRYEVTDAYVLGGTVVAPKSFFAKVEKILRYTPPAKQALPTDGWSLSPATYTYDGTEKTPAVTAPSGLEEGTDFTVTYTNNTNAGTATVTITGTGTYEGTIAPLTFTIKKATLAPTGLTTTGKANHTLADVALPELPEGFDGTLAWKDSTTSTGDVLGDMPFTAIYTPADTANYNTVEVSVVVTVTTADVFNIVYHGNGATFNGSETYTQECEINVAGTLDANKFTAPEGKTFGFWTLGTSSSGAVDATTKTCTDKRDYQALLDGIIETPAKEDEVHLYAYWIDESLGSYWMGKSGAATPDASTNVLKTQTDIEAYKTDNTFWTTLMNQDVRLYTVWNYDEVVTFANRFVEFRIIQVGAHDADGSNVTFMATHALPSGMQLNSDGSSIKGWSGSSLRAAMNTEDGYVMAGLSGLASDVTPVKKMQATYNTDTSLWNTKASLSETADAFWLLSYSELAGVDNNTSKFRNEGTQYTWCASNVTQPLSTNTSLEGTAKMRDGKNNPNQVTTGEYWWDRSPYIGAGNTGKTDFGRVKTDGSPDWLGMADVYFGVVPCFAL